MSEEFNEKILRAKEIISKDLLAYSMYMKPDYEAPRHLKLLIRKLEAVERGEIKRLIISMPPRSGKSLTTSELFPPWFMSKNPNRQFIATSYAASLAHTFGGKVRNYMSSPRHLAIFPDSVVSGRSQSGHKWYTEVGGSYLAVGRGGPTTGFGADCIVVDDILKNSQEARSHRIITGINNWFSETLYTRLMPGGAIIIMATRWADNDLIGYCLQEFAHENWEVINLQAICEDENDVLNRQIGEALWPERFPIDVLLQTKRTLKDSFSALYQGRPAPKSGSLVKRASLQYYTQSELKKVTFKHIYAAWDTASTVKNYSDFSVGFIFGVTEDDKVYLLDRYKGKVEFPELIEEVKKLASKWSA